MQGRRLPNPPEGTLPIDVEASMQPGDYVMLYDYQIWICRAPNGDLGSLRPTVHQITEHEDGTITVSPSIQFMTGQRWHGYLRNGVWSEQ